MKKWILIIIVAACGMVTCRELKAQTLVNTPPKIVTCVSGSCSFVQPGIATINLPVMTWTAAINWTVPITSGTLGVMFFHTKSAITITNLDILATTQATCTGTQSIEIWDQTASTGGIPQALTNSNSTFSTSGTLNIAAGHNVYIITTAGATCAIAPVINATVQYVMQ